MVLSKAIEASEVADVRYWSILHSDIRIANLYLDKGVYTIKAVLSRKKKGKKIKKEYPLGKIEIKRGKIVKDTSKQWKKYADYLYTMQKILKNNNIKF